MMLGKKGDIYFPGSSDYMEVAKKKDVVFPETEKNIVYLVPAINVQKGNPKNIKTLKDLSRPGLKVAIANPEGVCVGAYAVEIVESLFTPEEKEAFRRNLINYTESCEKTATAISLKAADAVIGWRVFHIGTRSASRQSRLKNPKSFVSGTSPSPLQVHLKPTAGSEVHRLPLVRGRQEDLQKIPLLYEC